MSKHFLGRLHPFSPPSFLHFPFACCVQSEPRGEEGERKGGNESSLNEMVVKGKGGRGGGGKEEGGASSEKSYRYSSTRKGRRKRGRKNWQWEGGEKRKPDLALNLWQNIFSSLDRRIGEKMSNMPGLLIGINYPISVGSA